MKAHRIDGYGDDRAAGMLDGGHAAGFVAQLHDDSTMNDAQNIGLGNAHHLSQGNP